MSFLGIADVNELHKILHYLFEGVQQLAAGLVVLFRIDDEFSDALQCERWSKLANCWYFVKNTKYCRIIYCSYSKVFESLKRPWNFSRVSLTKSTRKLRRGYH